MVRWPLQLTIFLLVALPCAAGGGDFDLPGATDPGDQDLSGATKTERTVSEHEGAQLAAPIHSDDEGSDAAADSGRQHEEWISVTAEMKKSAAAPLGASSTVIEPSLAGGTPSTLTAVVVETAGVSENGQGGHFQVFSIRGLSRHRVQTLVSGARINSERRAGASASFVDPLLLQSAEVLRGPSTTLHGSGAMGGVVQVFPRVYDDLSAVVGYDSRGNENYQVVGYGQEHWSLGFARRDAGNATAADGSELNGHFTQYSANLRGSWGKDKRHYEILYVPARGVDIGKSNTDYPGRVTTYPLERHHLLEFTVNSTENWRAQVSLHPHDLETEVIRPGQSRNVIQNESLDYGMRWDRDTITGRESRIHWGFQLAGRERVNSTEISESLDPGDRRPPEKLQTLQDARELEAGGFATYRHERGKTGFEVGGRLSGLYQRNTGFSSTNQGGMSGFAGITRRLGKRIKLRGALSTGLRFPSLSELFFSGTTGSGGIIGNPNLDPERSTGLEISLDWTGRRLFFGATVFQTEIADYIEREVVVDDLLTYRNLTSGRLRGFELQGLYLPGENWRVTYGGQYMRGRDDDDQPLADVPPDEIYLGFLRSRASWSFGSRLAYRAAKTDPGPAELARPSALLLRFTVDHRLSNDWTLSLTADNLLDEIYYPSADRKAPLAAGRSAGIMIGYRR